MEGILTALVTGLCVAVPSILATITTSKQNTKLTEYRFNEVKEDIIQLARTVEKHNGVVGRTAVLENDVKTWKWYNKLDAKKRE